MWADYVSCYWYHHAQPRRSKPEPHGQYLLTICFSLLLCQPCKSLLHIHHVEDVDVMLMHHTLQEHAWQAIMHVIDENILWLQSPLRTKLIEVMRDMRVAHTTKLEQNPFYWLCPSFQSDCQHWKMLKKTRIWHHFILCRGCTTNGFTLNELSSNKVELWMASQLILRLLLCEKSWKHVN